MDVRAHLDCSQCSLKDRCIGSGVSDVLARKEIKENRVYFRGEKLSNRTEDNGVYFIRTGLMRVLRKLPNGTSVTIDLITAGDMLGFPALFSVNDVKRCVDILDTSEICFIPNSNFKEWVKGSEQGRTRLISWVGQEFLRREEQICSLSHRSVRERTAEALLYLSDRFGSHHAEGVGIPTSLTREDIAALIGTARESVVRQLAELKDEGCIVLDGRQIVVVLPAQLKRIAKIEIPVTV